MRLLPCLKCTIYIYTYICIYIYIYIYIYYYTEAIDVITAVINTHQATLLSMSHILFGEHALEDAPTIHGDLFNVVMHLSHTTIFYLSRGMLKARHNRFTNTGVT
jgi:hypothetical protein